jgi:hypothetical protein
MIDSPKITSTRRAARLGTRLHLALLHWYRAFLLLFCCGGTLNGWLVPMASAATMTVDSRDALQRAVDAAEPGTEILIAPGTYRGGLIFRSLHGTAERPIRLAALDPQHPPTIQGGDSGIHLVRPAHVQVQHLRIRGVSGNGLNVDDGGDPDRPAHHLVIRDVEISRIGPRGNRDGIKLSGVDQFRVTGCLIQRWGDAGSAIDMVGCHQGVIEGCRFRYRDEVFANGVQTKGGSAQIQIRGCRFEHAGSRSVNLGGSTGEAYFRPRDAGYEAREITVEDCVFVGSMAPIAFVGVDGAVVRYNTLYRPQRWVARILQESTGSRFVPCRRGTFAHNLIVFRAEQLSTLVNVGSGTAPETFTFSANHWYCEDGRAARLLAGLPVPESSGTSGAEPQFVDASQGDFRPAEDSPVQSAGVRPPYTAARP